MKASVYRKKLAKYIKENSTQRKFAKLCGTYAAQVNGMIKGRNNHKGIAEKTGYKIVITYEPVEGVEQFF